MARFRYFSDVSGEAVDIIESSVTFLPGRGRVGTPVGFTPYFVQGQGWERGYIKVTRKVEYKAYASKHACDARCMNATGRIMKCECACGGRNHGRGAFQCEAA